MTRFILIPTLAMVACASSHPAASPQPVAPPLSAVSSPPVESPQPPESSKAASSELNVATLHIRPGEDSQARVISFNGVPFDTFAKPWAKPGPYRILIRPGQHELRVVIPGMCTYYDGTPGTGSSIATMRFTATAGAQYEVNISSYPSQILTVNEVHVVQLLEDRYHERRVEKTVATERDPSSCPNGGGITP